MPTHGAHRVFATAFTHIRVDFIYDTRHEAAGEKRDRSNLQGAASLAEVRRLLFAGKPKEAEILAEKNIISIPKRMPPYQPLGDPLIRFRGQQEAREFPPPSSDGPNRLRSSIRFGASRVSKELHVALIAGPAYDPLYHCLPAFTEATGVTANVAFRGDHPALNRHLASLADVTYDLVSTHTKYAPSQLSFLAPLDELIDEAALQDFVPMVFEMAHAGGSLYGLPRNIDVRLLHYRTDLIESPPATWNGLLELARSHNSPPEHYGFLFPGRESGLFGTFFELAEMAGARLFPEDLVPDIENEAGRWALGLLRTFYVEGLLPPEIPEWHYDKIHECFRAGRAAMVGDWPGYYGLYRDASISKVYDRLGLSPYPIGPAGKSLSYGGGHTFALTRRGANKPEALELLLYLTAFDQQLFEARNGCVPVRRSVMRKMQEEADPANRARLAMLEKVIAEHILIPPKFARYPEVEEVLWRTVQRVIVDQLSVDDGLRLMREQIKQIVEGD